jgi:hypothetical protein
MSTKNLFAALCASALATAALADDAHHPEDKTAPVPAQPAAKSAPQSSDATAMQGNMKRMQEQMARIRATADPGERQRLMSEHMNTMQESMSKMHDMMGNGKGMDSRAMQRQMGMMQMMMQQMMEHEAAAHSAPK